MHMHGSRTRNWGAVLLIMVLCCFSTKVFGQATLVSPEPGSVLPGPGVTFTWAAGTGTTQYDLLLGTSGPGSMSLYTSGWLTTTSTTVPSLPANGATVYARLYSLGSEGQQYVDYTFTAATSAPATMVSPSVGSVLGASNQVFSWTAGTDVAEYQLWLGLGGPGSSSLYASGWLTTTSTTVPNLPARGATIYARLYSTGSGGEQYNDYTFIEGTSIPAAMISPSVGGVLGASGQIFTWTAGTDVAEYQLWMGLSGPGSSSLYTSGWLTTTSTTVPSLPANGATVYARLYSRGHGGMQWNDYVFNEAGGALLSAFTCANASMTGAGTIACAVTLNAAAPAGGLAVSLSSSSTAAAVPSTVTVPANTSSAGFITTVSAVTTTQPVTLTAIAVGVSQTVVLQLNTNVPTLSVVANTSPSTYGGAVTFTATISSGPTGAVTFYDSGAAIGTGAINGTTASFTTSSLTAGSHSISASWAGNNTYSPATSVAVSQVVTRATPAINWNNPAAVLYGTALSGAQLAATSALPGSFAYSPAAGTVLDAGAQNLSVTFTPTDTVDYNNATASVLLTVNKATPTISWAAPSSIAFGTALNGSQLNASASAAGTFLYSPAAGTVPGAGVQTLSVTFTPTDTTDFVAVTASVSLTVNTATPTITWPAPGAIVYGTPLSATQLDASASVPGTFVYSPAAGTVLTSGSQTISVTFTPTDATDYTGATATATLTVNKATSTITWTVPAAIAYGTALNSTQLNATSTVPGTFAYTPAAGTVLSSGSQTLSVAFTPTDTTDYNSATSTVILTVNKATPTIVWATPASIAYGTALSASQLNATASVPGTLAYTPASGTVLTSGSQTLSVTFTPADTTDYNAATVSVALTVNKATPTITWATPAGIAYGTALSSSQLNATASVPGAFVYTPAVGTVLTFGSQSLSVSFTPTDTTDYNTATASVTLTVSKATPAISWATPAGIVYGTALGSAQLNATSTAAGTFSYTPSAGTVLTSGSQTLSVSFTPTDTTDYNTATASVALTVNKATPTINWATPAAITAGTALSSTQLDATASVPGSFVYSPASGAVLAAGAQTLTVIFTPTDTVDYNTASVSVTLTVNPGTATLGINATTIAFGNVNMGQPSTQMLTLTSTGTGPVTVNSAAATGTGFTVSGSTLPVTLAPGQTATLGVEFNPTVTGAATGSLTISSTSSTNPTAMLALSGTGMAVSYQVNLSWDAPVDSTDPVAGYNVYRALSGSTMYQLVNASVESQTAYVDTTVQDGSAYDYIVESVDASGVASAPTSPVLVTIP
jgi:Bacterial Ig-like domain (group 3)/Abnormal spindle-like microcephaly-assoc'd, ASPM-SPD-2-Hydin